MDFDIDFALSIVSLILATIFLVLIIATFSVKNNNPLSVAKILLISALVITNLIREEWFLVSIWGLNLVLNILINPKILELLKSLVDEPMTVDTQPFEAPYDTVGTNCTACGAKNEYPVDGKAHYCTHCGTVLPRAL